MVANYGQNIVQRSYNGPSYVPPPVAPPRRPQQVRTIYSHKTTKNKSFLDMHHYLQSIGVKNNEFMINSRHRCNVIKTNKFDIVRIFRR